MCWLLVGAEENQVRGASDGGVGVYGKDSKDDVCTHPVVDKFSVEGLSLPQR